MTAVVMCSRCLCNIMLVAGADLFNISKLIFIINYQWVHYRYLIENKNDNVNFAIQCINLRKYFYYVCFCNLKRVIIVLAIKQESLKS